MIKLLYTVVAYSTVRASRGTENFACVTPFDPYNGAVLQSMVSDRDGWVDSAGAVFFQDDSWIRQCCRVHGEKTSCPEDRTKHDGGYSKNRRHGGAVNDDRNQDKQRREEEVFSVWSQHASSTAADQAVSHHDRVPRKTRHVSLACPPAVSNVRVALSLSRKRVHAPASSTRCFRASFGDRKSVV